MRLLLDHGLPTVLAERLGELGYDVAMAGGGEDVSAEDAATLARAGQDGRALVTQNIGDFLALADTANGTPIIFASPIRYPRSPLTVDRLVFHLDSLLAGPQAEAVATGGVHWLETPPGCPFLGPPSSRQ